MARMKSEMNKSEAIREAYKTIPNAKAKEIVAHLKAKGIEVTAGLVYQVKKTSKKKKVGPKRGRAQHSNGVIARSAKVATGTSNGRLGVGASISIAKAAAEKVGGWAALKEIVDALQ